MTFSKLRKPIILVLLGFLLLTFGEARSERLPLRAYTVAEGLAHNEINKIVRDSRGFLWFCTGEGLSRFDGYSFTNYGVEQGLPHNHVTDFLETRSGELWLGTGGGLVRFNPKGTPVGRVVYAHETPAEFPMFITVGPKDEDRRARYISVLHEGHDGTIWTGTNKGLYRLEYSGNQPRVTYVDIGWPGGHISSIWDLLEDRFGTLWIASLGKLSRRWPDGSAGHYTIRDGLPDDNFHDLFQDHRGQLWAATRRSGFFRFTADQTHARPVVTGIYSEQDGLSTVWVFNLFETTDRRFWVATDKGVTEFLPDAAEQESKFRNYTQRNGLLYWGVTTLNEDPVGNLWLGSTAGAMKLAREGFVTYGEQDGLFAVAAIFEDRSGKVCFRGSVFGDERTSVFEGAKSNGPEALQTPHTRFGRFDGERFSWFKPDIFETPQLGWVGEMVTLQASNGEWWLGTGVGLYRFTPSDNFTQLKQSRPLVAYTTKDGLTAPQIFRLFEDSRGDVWVSTISPNGLARWERQRESWHDMTNAPGLPSLKDDLARSFGQDRDGNIWIGFNGGVARYHDGGFYFFTTKDGLPVGSVMNFHTDQQGRLWFTSARGGFVRVDNQSAEQPSFINYTTANGLSSNNTEVITEDLNGHIYVSTGRGLDRFDPATGRFKHFTTADGLAPGPLMAAFRDRNGVLWFGTGKGLSRYVPSTNNQIIPAPPILFTGVSIAGESQAVSALGETHITLPDIAAARNQIQIDFVGLSFAPGEVLRYQYKLEGSNTDWSSPVEQRNINYASLAPGSYRFFVRALNSDGAVSSEPASLTFTVLPPVWQRWWFITLTGLALCLAVYAAYRYRVARLLEVAEIRTRIATDLHDDIGANLTKIAILSEVVKQQSGNGEEANDGHPLSSIARISRESVTAMSDIVWAINPERDSLVDLVRRMRQHAEEVFTLCDIRLSFNTPPTEKNLKLGADVRRDLLLIFKEAINNAARHSGCSKVKIDFVADGSHLVLRIEDDGSGFNPSVASEGQGLFSMRRRAEKLGGTFEVASSHGSGTTVAVKIPATVRHHV